MKSAIAHWNALVESKGEGPSSNIAQCIECGEAKSCVGWFKRQRWQSPPWVSSSPPLHLSQPSNKMKWYTGYKEGLRHWYVGCFFWPLPWTSEKNPIVGILLMQIGNKKGRSHSLTEERNNLRNDASIISNSPAICIICKIAIRHYAA